MNYEKWYAVIDSAVEALFDHDFDYDRAMGMSTIAYVKEFRTLNLGLPRQIGKTRYIANHANCGDVIIAHNRMMADYYEKNYCVLAHSPSQFAFNSGYRKGINADKPRFPYTIWIDEPTRMTERELDECIARLVTSPRQRIIMLGTA